MCHSKSRAIHAESLGQGKIIGHKEWKTRIKKAEGHCTGDTTCSSLDMKLLKSFKSDIGWKKGKSLNEYLNNVNCFVGKASWKGTFLQLPLITVHWPLWFEQLGLHLVVLFEKVRTFRK